MPRYDYQNKPCANLRTGVARPFAISGVDSKDNSGGILEYCDTRQEAEELVKEMKRDSLRFKYLEILTWFNDKKHYYCCMSVAYYFNCTCEWAAKHPGTNSYSCEWCGFYAASSARCADCREYKE